MSRTTKYVIATVAIAAVLLVILAFLQNRLPQTTVFLEELYFGETIGVGMVTDKQDVDSILQCVDNLEFFNYDINNISGGGGIAVTIFQSETVRRYTFTDGLLVKDKQDDKTTNWYKSPKPIYSDLQGLLQKKYPVPEW